MSRKTKPGKKLAKQRQQELRQKKISLFARHFLQAHWPALAVFAGMHAVFWYCYPYPYVTADSGEYVSSAQYLMNNPYRPLGYAVFLALCHFFSSSAQAVPHFQALVYLLSLLYFLHQLHAVLALSDRANKTLGVLLALNPLPFFYTRHLLSDSIFVALTLCFVGSLLRYYHAPHFRALVHVIVWGGLSLFVRHIGLFYLFFAGAVILIKRRKQALPHAATFACSSFLIIGAICFKMKEDLGVFRMNTFEGWTMWAIAAPYIDLAPENKNALAPERLKDIYDFLAAYPAETYRGKSGEWHKWNNDSPAKKLLFAYIEQNRMNYYDAWIRTNDDLKLVSQNILRRHIPEYVREFFLPSLLQGLWPNMVVSEGSWNNYPLYSKREKPDEAIQAYYGEDSSTWQARFEIFPRIKPLMDLWVRALMPLLLLVAIAYLIFRKTLPLAQEAPVFLLLFGFVWFYLLGVGLLSIIFTRYLAPITPFTLALIFLGIWRIVQSRLTN